MKNKAPNILVSIFRDSRTDNLLSPNGSGHLNAAGTPLNNKSTTTNAEQKCRGGAYNSSFSNGELVTAYTPKPSGESSQRAHAVKVAPIVLRGEPKSASENSSLNPTVVKAKPSDEPAKSSSVVGGLGNSASDTTPSCQETLRANVGKSLQNIIGKQNNIAAAQRFLAEFITNKIIEAKETKEFNDSAIFESITEEMKLHMEIYKSIESLQNFIKSDELVGLPKPFHNNKMSYYIEKSLEKNHEILIKKSLNLQNDESLLQNILNLASVNELFNHLTGLINKPKFPEVSKEQDLSGVYWGTDKTTLYSVCLYYIFKNLKGSTPISDEEKEILKHITHNVEFKSSEITANEEINFFKDCLNKYSPLLQKTMENDVDKYTLEIIHSGYILGLNDCANFVSDIYQIPHTPTHSLFFLSEVNKINKKNNDSSYDSAFDHVREKYKDSTTGCFQLRDKGYYLEVLNKNVSFLSEVTLEALKEGICIGFRKDVTDKSIGNFGHVGIITEIEGDYITYLSLGRSASIEGYYLAKLKISELNKDGCKYFAFGLAVNNNIIDVSGLKELISQYQVEELATENHHVGQNGQSTGDPSAPSADNPVNGSDSGSKEELEAFPFGPQAAVAPARKAEAAAPAAQVQAPAPAIEAEAAFKASLAEAFKAAEAAVAAEAAFKASVEAKEEIAQGGQLSGVASASTISLLTAGTVGSYYDSPSDESDEYQLTARTNETNYNDHNDQNFYMSVSGDTGPHTI